VTTIPSASRFSSWTRPAVRGVTKHRAAAPDRFEGTLAFQPQTAPGDYFVYYLPFTPQPGWGSYEKDYVRPQETKSEWKDRLPQNTGALPRATVVRLEARTEFDSFYPMEVVATPEETQVLLDTSAAPYLLFPEDAASHPHDR